MRTAATFPGVLEKTSETFVRAISEARSRRTPAAAFGAATESVEVSVVIPCLNEAQSLALCIDKAFAAFKAADMCGEVIVSDNGSTDGSIQIAEDHGARVVHADIKGYGSALRRGSRPPVVNSS